MRPRATERHSAAFRFSANVIQVGAWSLVFSHPRTSRSTPPATSSLAAGALSKKWSIRMPALRA
jgi:hypothetical protein